MRLYALRTIALTLFCCLAASTQTTAHAQAAPQAQAQASTAPGLLTREQAEAILPHSVFYRGQSATLQGRNSAGIRTASGKLVLAALVDTSGYSSAVAERYQAYLITEVPLRVGTGTLPPGAYGFGFLPNRMVVMDLGSNELLSTPTVKDDTLRRPNPLQIVREGGQDRLYLGKSYVVLSPEPGGAAGEKN